jgi:hypothetical protein
MMVESPLAAGSITLQGALFRLKYYSYFLSLVAFYIRYDKKLVGIITPYFSSKMFDIRNFLRITFEERVLNGK